MNRAPGANPIKPMGKTNGLTHKHYTRLERRTMNKHSSLLATFLVQKIKCCEHGPRVYSEH
jgi:hypothetical protein